jgi:hypothetical protein
MKVVLPPVVKLEVVGLMLRLTVVAVSVGVAVVVPLSPPPPHPAKPSITTTNCQAPGLFSSAAPSLFSSLAINGFPVSS